MDRAALDARHNAAVTRWARQLDDEGRVPPGLLAELAAVADQHAADAAMAAVAAGPLGVQPEEVRIMHVPAPAARTAAQGPAGRPERESPPPAPATPPAARTAPPRSTRTRTR